MTKKLHILFAAMASTSALVSTAGSAQSVAASDTGDNPVREAAAVVREARQSSERRIVQAQGPIERSGYAAPAPTFQLSADKGETEVSLGIAHTLARTRSKYKQDVGEDRRHSTTTIFSLQGFAPLNKNGDDTFVNLADPVDGTRLKLGVVLYSSHYVLRRSDILEGRRVVNLTLSNCVKANVQAWADEQGRSEEEIATAGAYLVSFAQQMEGERPRAESAIDNINSTFDLPEELENRCIAGISQGGSANIGRLIARYGAGADQEAPIRALAGDAPTFFLGIEGTVGHKSFSFLDRSAFEIKEINRTGYQLSAFGGVIGASSNWSLRGGFSRSRTYSAEDDVELCQTTAVAGTTQCLTGADGPPSGKTRNVISVEGRLLVNLRGVYSQIGIAPEIAFDVKTNDYTIDVPIYFAPNKQGQLTGGIRVGYDSKKDAASYGLFVGVPFGVFQ